MAREIICGEYLEGEKQSNFIRVEARVGRLATSELNIGSGEFIDKYADILKKIILGDEELKRAAEENEPGAAEKIKERLLACIRENTGVNKEK